MHCLFVYITSSSSSNISLTFALSLSFTHTQRQSNLRLLLEVTSVFDQLDESLPVDSISLHGGNIVHLLDLFFAESISELSQGVGEDRDRDRTRSLNVEAGESV